MLNAGILTVYVNVSIHLCDLRRHKFKKKCCESICSYLVLVFFLFLTRIPKFSEPILITQGPYVAYLDLYHILQLKMHL